MSGENLWKDYRFLTREMETFIARQELDMFYELMNQREQLQLMIEAEDDGSFLQTDAGREMTRELQDTEALISTQLRGSMSQLKQRRQVQNAYHGGYSNRVGARTDYSG